jgi:hypothetical protein
MALDCALDSAGSGVAVRLWARGRPRSECEPARGRFGPAADFSTGAPCCCALRLSGGGGGVVGAVDGMASFCNHKARVSSRP